MVNTSLTFSFIFFLSIGGLHMENPPRAKDRIATCSVRRPRLFCATSGVSRTSEMIPSETNVQSTRQQGRDTRRFTQSYGNKPCPESTG